MDVSLYLRKSRVSISSSKEELRSLETDELKMERNKYILYLLPTMLMVGFSLWHSYGVLMNARLFVWVVAFFVWFLGRCVGITLAMNRELHSRAKS